MIINSLIYAQEELFITKYNIDKPTVEKLSQHRSEIEDDIHRPCLVVYSSQDIHYVIEKFDYSLLGSSFLDVKINEYPSSKN